MNILQKIKELNIPNDQYVVIGSGTMSALGIREANDIDMSVTEELFDKLKETGEWEEFEKYGRPFLKKDVFDINKHLGWEKYSITIQEANNSALFIEDIPFMNLDELIKFKAAMGREKDFKDIELIKEYLNKLEKRVRAVIIEDEKVLLMHRFKNGKEYWVFPGGGVDDTDKSLEDGLRRECLEELGVVTEVGDFLMEKFYVLDNLQGQIQYFYNCKIISGEVGTGTGPEWENRDVEKYGTYEVVWMPASELKNKTVYPFEVRDKIFNKLNKEL
jgi:8-oxo-dGTP pyrophosphatase MutT (NUDIX family)